MNSYTIIVTQTSATPNNERKVDILFELGVQFIILIQSLKSDSIIFIFLVLTLISSISTTAFVTRTVFAKKSSIRGQ
jgi:hypothetical protein